MFFFNKKLNAKNTLWFFVVSFLSIFISTTCSVAAATTTPLRLTAQGILGAGQATTTPAITTVVTTTISRTPGTLLFLGNQNIAPVVYLVGAAPTGVAVDIVKELAKHMSLPVDIRAMDWPTAQALVAEGQADALIQINATEARRKIYDFSDPLLESHFSIFTNTNRLGISGVATLEGLRVGVEKGGLPEHLLAEDPQIILVEIPNFLDGFTQLNTGTLDAVVVDERVGSYVVAQNRLQGIKVAGDPILPSYSAIAVKKGNEKLLNEINAALQIIKTDGTYQAVLDKWKPVEVVFQTQAQITQEVLLISVLVLSVLLLISGISAVVLRRELTKRKKAEKYSEKLISSANAMIVGLDRDGKVTVFNEAAEKVTGYSKNEVIGRNWFELAVPRDRFPEVWKMFTESQKSGKFVTGDFQNPILTKSGEERVIEWRNSELRDDANVVGTISYGVDITARVQAEHKVSDVLVTLKRLSHLNEAILSAIPTPVFYKDKNSLYLGCNRAFTEVMGLTTEQIKGKRADELWPKEDAEMYRKKDLELMHNPGRQIYEYKVRDKDGVDRPVIYAKDVFYDENDEVAGIVGAFLDISELKKVERERMADLKFFESMDKVNLAMQKATTLDIMMSDVLDVVLAVFDCDRAFLMYPCDPDAPMWSSPMERTKPEYPGVHAQNLELPMDEEVSRTLRELLASDRPVKFGPETNHPLPEEVAKRFGFLSFMSIAVYPKVGKPWQFGIHQCSYARVWTDEEERLLQEIGRRLADSLTNGLVSQDLKSALKTLNETQFMTKLGSWELDIVSNSLKWSDEIYKIFEIDQEKFGASYEAFLDAIHPDDRDKVNTAYTESVKNHKPYGIDHRLLMSDGRIKYVHEHGETFYNKEGTPLRSVGTVQDITERYQAEEELRMSEEKYRTLVQKIKVAVVVHGADTQVITSNTMAQELLGLTEDQMLGKTGIDQAWHFSREDGTIMSTEEYPVNRVISLRQPLRDYVVKLHRTQGLSDVWVLVNADPVFDEHKNITQVIVTFIDITSRKEAEEEIRESEEKFSAAFFSSPDLMAITRVSDGMIMEINAGYTQMLGYSRDESIGKTTLALSIWANPLDRSKFVEALQKDGQVIDFETKFRRKDGSLVSVIESARTFDIRGEASILSIAHDITKRKLEEERLKELDKLKDDFLMVTTHELKSPLIPIKSQAQLLLAEDYGELNEEQKNAMEMILRNEEAINELASAVLDISKIKSNKLKLVLESENIGNIVSEAVKEMEDLAVQKHLSIALSLPPDLPNTMLDKLRIKQVLLNLLDNAIKFTSEYGFIRIEVNRKENEIEVRVKDTGIGINKEDMGKLFIPFSRVESDVTRKYRGTGLGLAISRGLIEQHRGRIWAESEGEGMGSTFAFTLPI